MYSYISHFFIPILLFNYIHMTSLLLSKSNRDIAGQIELTGSKSISNRILLIRALSQVHFPIHCIAAAKDTQTLLRLLDQKEGIFDTGPAGTTYRFMTAYLALQPGKQILTGSERMLQRPIGILVDALRELGANINYLEKEGYPPLEIGEMSLDNGVNTLSIPADTSSQYISALLMIAPLLPQGLNLTLTGKIVSRPYIDMTLNIMQQMGINYKWDANTIYILPQQYTPRDFTVEADWSAASYYFSLAALGNKVDLQINGLFEESTQGDAAIVDIMKHLGVMTTFTHTGIRLTKQAVDFPSLLVWDFITCPDIAQTVLATCAGLGIPAHFTGLETLKIKETDRLLAMQTELAKTNVSLFPTTDSCTLEGQTQWAGTWEINTYEDHRMAMALAPLALLGTQQINEPMVVEKSYPMFWEDLQLLGFQCD